jgi:tape measure domain-containing protein
VSVVANVAINVDSRGAVGQLRAVEQQAKTTEKAFGGITGAIGKLGIAFAGIQAAQFIFAKTAELESQTRSLQTLTGSAEKAGQIIKQLQDLGAVTPFTSTELIDAAKRLQAFGVEGNKVVETTKRLADVSGATGAELQGLVTAYGQVQAKGRLQGEELLQFQERGVALQKELQKMYGLSGEELQKALSKGQISAEAVEVAIIRLTNAGGKYANGAIAQSDTLNGKFSTLQDGIEALAKKIGTTLSPQIKNIINLAISGIEQINALFATGLKGDYSRRIAVASTQMTAGARSEALDTTAKILREIRDTPQKETIGGVQAQLEALRGVEIVLNKLNNASVLPPNTLNRVLAQNQAITTLRQNLEGYLKQLKTATPKQATPATPALLQPKEKAGRGMQMDQLLNPAIMQALQLDIARQETMKQNDLLKARGSENEDQAKRMIEYAHQYRKSLLETKALTMQIRIIDKERSAFIASYSKDKQADAAIMIDQKKADILSKIQLITEGTNTIAAEHYNAAAEANRKEEEFAKKQLEDQAKLGQQRYQSLTDELQILQARLSGNEAEVILKQQIRDLMIGTQGLAVQDITNTVNQINATKQLLTEKEKVKNLVQGIGGSIESGIVSAIDAAVTGAQSLQDVLSGVLKDIGKMLISFGIRSLLGGVNIGGTPLVGKAAGGPVAGGTPYVVGEKGPELFVPGASGTIIPNDAMSRYQRQNSSAGAAGGGTGAAGDGSPASWAMNFETTQFLGQDWVSKDQLMAAMAATEKRATAAGAKAGAQQVATKMRTSPAFRRQVGVK